MAEPLVLLPGLLNDHRLFAAQSDLAAEIVVPELWRDDTVAALAERVLATAPPRFALVGFSMGGYVAFEILRRAKQRVTRLALVDTSARADSDEQRQRRRALISQSGIGEFKGVTARLLPLLVHKDRLNDTPLVATLQAMAQSIGREGFVRQQRAILARPDSRAELAAIEVPTAVICGREDALTPLEHSQEMAAGIENARLTVIERCGHVSPLERPEAVNAALRLWLA
ncbi:MAG: alpha/beta fold hydrolase [Rhodospirillales bacterium]